MQTKDWEQQLKQIGLELTLKFLITPIESELARQKMKNAISLVYSAATDLNIASIAIEESE